MSQFGQELSLNDDAPALPLWIDGRAFLMMAEQFHSVVNAKGQAVRRVPLYGAEAVTIAGQSTTKAVAAWAALSAAEREACFQSLHELLTRFRAHFERLLVDEAGLSQDLAVAEVEQALAAIANRLAGTPARPGGIAAVASDSLAPLATPLACAIDALAAGWGVILKPSTKAPSALFACAELFSRAGFPAGLVNCVHGDEAVMRALCADAAITALAFAGGPELSQRIAALAAETGKPCATGQSLPSAWSALLGYAA